MLSFIYSLMTDSRKGRIFEPFKFLLYMASLIYMLALVTRKIFYGLGLFKTYKAPVRVISVGNLTLGGTGKTPFVMSLARILKDDIKKEAVVLIRGYGWDEQAMLKRKLPDIPVLVGEDRVRSCHKAIKLYGADTAILDDGFQYWELARNLNIVLIDSRNPFGNGFLFPRGVLREPKRAIERADMVFFTKVSKKSVDIGALEKELMTINARLLFGEAVHKPGYFFDAKTGSRFGLSAVQDKKAVLLSSIGDSAYFEETVKDLGSRIVEHIIFNDHHNYSESDIAHIVKRCDERSFDLVITTEKDAVKLSRMNLSLGRYALIVLAITMEIVSGRENLIDRLHSLYNG